MNTAENTIRFRGVTLRRERKEGASRWLYQAEEADPINGYWYGSASDAARLSNASDRRIAHDVASAARSLGSARTPAKAAAVRANGARGGRPVVLGTISTPAGTGTVRYAPGRGRVEVVLPDGTVEVPEEAAVSSREEALRTAEAWYRDRTWEWSPAR